MPSHLFVADPVERYDVTKDSTFALMLAAQGRGHEVWWCDTDGLRGESGVGQARCWPLKVQKQQGSHVQRGEATVKTLAAFDAVWMRKDPPFDLDYIAATYVLDLAPLPTRVFSQPQGLRDWNEKTSILRFADVAPPMLLTRDMAAIRQFQHAVGGSIVLKPLAFSGGAGIVALHPGDLNTRSLVEMATHEGTRFVVAQQYLPEVVQGDKRVILVDGVARAGLLRVPPPDDLRGNIHVGAKVSLSGLTAREQAVCERIGPALKQAGHLFVGIDLIGERLTEINVTSPTGIQEIRDLGGPDLADELIEAGVAD
jgi:glutathione synthase